MGREAADFYFFNDLFNEKMRNVKMWNYLTKSQNLKKSSSDVKEPLFAIA